MGVPKRRRSKAVVRRRRAELMKLKKVGFVLCTNCHEPKLPHRVCPACGHYKGREVVSSKE
ncbi:MAG TPA: 50S ribosomal protein L32 [Clostridia bacterium]|jgi:large subunit ribosomal protein L32|nr:50S ribosomal protein L32 [Clostridia bacterium]